MWMDRAHREYFWALVRRDLRVRYAGSTLGGLWNLIHPLMMIAIYMMIFSSLMASRMRGAGAGGVDYGPLAYGVHLCAGLLPWLVFSDVLLRSLGVLIDHATFLKKIAFPPLVLFASVLFNALLIHGCGYLIFLAILAAIGHPPPLSALGGTAVMALAGAAAMGLGLMLAGLNVFFRDTAQIVTVLMQLLFWFNPIVYPKEQIMGVQATEDTPAALLTAGRWMLTLNPVERFITATQSLVGVAATPPTAWDWALIAIFPCVCLGAGLCVFRRMLPDVRDCL